jgi:site-specific DNA recombinase
MEPYLNEESTDNEFMLYLNLGIAQRERKAVGDHIRIKIAGSKERGLWMGGNPPLGYDIREKKLIINEEEAKVIEHMFARFMELKSVTALVKEINSQGYRTKRFQAKSGNFHGGEEFKKATVRRIITNPTYIGKVRHHEKHYQGQHKGVIKEGIWCRAQELIENRPFRAIKYQEALLKSVIRCQRCNVSMTPTYTKKKNKHYRYYVCSNHLRGKYCPSMNRTVAAGEVERIVIERIKYLLEKERLGMIWDHLFPVKQEEMIKKLTKSVWVGERGIEICISSEGLQEVKDAA